MPRGRGGYHPQPVVSTPPPPPPPPSLPVTPEKVEVEKKPEASPSGTPKLRDQIDAVFRSIDAEWNKLEEARKQLEKERNSFEEMKARHATVHLPNRIKLSIGGTVFATSLSNLKRDTNSMLAAWFSGKGFDMTPDEDGCYFIDRDGTYFNYIMSYLRSGEINLPDDEGTLSLLLKEVDFYQLRELSNAIHEQIDCPFKGSNILAQRREWCSHLERWIGAKKKWNSIFKSTPAQDPNLSTSCLNACAGKGEVLLVIKTTSGNIVGGYTRVGFPGLPIVRQGEMAVALQHGYIQDSAAFLFRLSGHAVKFPCQQPGHALQRTNGNNICFGNNDLLIQGVQVYSQQSGMYAINTMLLVHNSQEQISELEAFCVV